MTSLKEVYITLLSDDSLEYFPENSPSQFSNVLAHDIAVGAEEYEIGLVSLNLNLKENDTTKPKLEFDKDDKITMRIPSTSSDTVDINGTVDKLLPAASFITTLTTKFAFFGNINFSLDFVDETTSFVTAHVTLPDGYVILESILAQILGFDQTIFKAGKYRASKPFNKDLLAITSAKAVVSYVKYEEKKFDLPQPEDDTLDGLAETIHKAFQDADETVFVTVDDEQEYMTFEAQKDYLEFKLPSKLCDWFGIPSSRMFSKKTSVFVSNTKEHSSREHLLVCLNLVGYQAYGSQEFPILRTVTLDGLGIKSRFQKNYESVQYIPLLQSQFRTVSVTLILHSASVNFDIHPSSVVLHIRKRSSK